MVIRLIFHVEFRLEGVCVLMKLTFQVTWQIHVRAQDDVQC